MTLPLPNTVTSRVKSTLTAAPNSYAPMSQAAPACRGKPRWSVDKVLPSLSVQPPVFPPLMAELPTISAWVKVGPPLGPSGSSRGLVFCWSPVAVKPQELSSLKL